ncbi:phytoene desaturase family protein [Luteimicrobium subarcticum]|uniref:Phytoene desaturase n=1 Tax=Luteimicrobium subarcticum TaxID=620910 RepID=A0A2M8WTC3_9MICO|nr:phytoene desaturase family protein [Luteimicrobium subarcticum]PJI94183.1 phytoene desaturase [Luteimicrobium subarcticum]
MSRVVVVGAGIAGLASAALLARDGHQVTVLERNDHVGGRVATWHEDGFTFDLGPSWYLMPEVFERFFARLGTSVDAELDLVPLPTAYRVFLEDGARLEITDEVEATRALFEARDPGAGAALDAYLASASDTYRLALDRFLYTDFAGAAAWRDLARGLGPRALGRLVRLATTSLWDRTAHATRDHGLRQVLAYPAVFLGASPYEAPALYHLMSHLDLVEGVRYPMGGFSTITDAVARLAVAAGAEIRTGCEVEQVLVDDVGRARRSRRPVRRSRGAVRGVRCRDVRSPAAGAEEVPADVVVAAGDLHHTETRLLEPQWQTYPEPWWAGRDPGPGAVLLCLGVRGEVDALAHHNLFFTQDWQANFDAVFGPGHRMPDPASVYVCRPSATDPGVAPDGHENLFVLVPVPPDVTLTPDDPRVRALADRVVRQIDRWAGVPFLAERVVVRHVLTPSSFAETLHSWSGGALGPAHTLRQSAMLRARGASARVDGLVYAGGSTIPGVGLPMCLISAELAAARVGRIVGAVTEDSVRSGTERGAV